MELSGSDIKNFIIFSCTSGNGNPEKNSLHLRKRKPIKNFLYFEKWNFKA